MEFGTGDPEEYASAATYATGCMMSELSKGMDYMLLERTHLDELLSEQALSKTGAIAENSLVESGKMLGADYIMFGTVDSKRKESSGFSFFITSGSEKTFVKVTARIVDTRTGEVVMAGEVDGKKRSGSTFKVGLPGLPETSLLSTKLVINQQIDDATAEAVRDGVTQLVQEFKRQKPLYANVVKIEGENIYLNVGTEQGVQKKDKFQLITSEKVIRNASTGEVVDVIEKYGDKLTVKEANANSCICSGNKVIHVNDKMKRIIKK